MAEYDYIAENLRTVRENIEKASRRAGRSGVRLVAVTKSATDDEVRALLRLGVEAIGENRAQLFNRRADLVAECGCDTEVHLIGSLQTNKVRSVIDRAACIQSVDRLSLATEIEKQAAKRNTTVRVLLEVNSGREEAKGGIMPEELFAFHAAVAELPHIEIAGLMTMAPHSTDPEDYRPYFRETYTAFARIRDGGGFIKDPILSMGMSESYEVAVEEGATMVRVGSSLFRK